MVQYYTNRELSNRLKINIARWKRWSREFLPPDPLGGLQSGYARQYNLNDAFTVFIGGYLVKDLDFAIPEAKQILLDLRASFIEMGFLESFDEVSKPHTKTHHMVKHYQIYITKVSGALLGHGDLHYRVRGVIEEEIINILDEPVRQTRYLETIPNKNSVEDNYAPMDILPVKVVPISALFDYFMTTLAAAGTSSSNNS
jgi:hypothetical protein